MANTKYAIAATSGHSVSNNQPRRRNLASFERLDMRRHLVVGIDFDVSGVSFQLTFFGHRKLEAYATLETAC